MDYLKTKFFNRRSDHPNLDRDSSSNGSSIQLLSSRKHKSPIIPTSSQILFPFTEDSSNDPNEESYSTLSSPTTMSLLSPDRECTFSPTSFQQNNQTLNQESRSDYFLSDYQSSTNLPASHTPTSAITQTSRTRNTSQLYTQNSAAKLSTSPPSFTNFSRYLPNRPTVHLSGPLTSQPGPSALSPKNQRDLSHFSSTSLRSTASLHSSTSFALGSKGSLPISTFTTSESQVLGAQTVPPRRSRFRKVIGSNNENHHRLARLLLRSDLAVVQALCNSLLYAEEVNQMATSLLTLFQNQGLGLALIQQIIHAEIMRAEDEGTLMRNTSGASILMSAYVRMNSFKYLSLLFKPLIHHLLSSRISIEIDPNRLEMGENLDQNLENLFRMSKRFLDEICASVDYCPRPLRLLSRILQEEVNLKFPESAQTSMGGFFFLRFLCPAIVTPDAFNIIAPSALNKGSRRSLILISKVLQSLTNGVPFGDKEDYMVPLNQFILDNTQILNDFFTSLTDVELEDHPVRCGGHNLKSSLSFVSECIHRHRPRIEEELNIIIENNGPFDYDPFDIFSFFLASKKKKKKQKPVSSTV
eukprot:TRINITY_DN13151_c0_g1_i1.p1 TRINITY_DN13151_c0_g1~~TRINITY_DN13151_c0_g1_i1.p1  ORF type:complete len:616 (+),score=116.56 TRINITY_DN13151_c0_g1_i1:100-1848(+)